MAREFSLPLALPFTCVFCYHGAEYAYIATSNMMHCKASLGSRKSVARTPASLWARPQI